MVTSFLRRAVVSAGFGLIAASSAAGADSAALLDALVRKGILTEQEAAELRQEVERPAAAAPVTTVPSSKHVTRLRLSGRLQPQFDWLNTDVAGATDPASTSHFFLRRIYLTAKADLGPNWNATITYDFAGSLFDAAYVQWKGEQTSVDIGLRKVNFGFEERTSSGSLKAIERSGVTRYFVEGNNGRRLGGGGYRIGLFADREQGNFFYGAAITNPERPELASSAAGTGNSGNNRFAYWANAGYKHALPADGEWVLGAGVGLLPDQGGKASASPFGVGSGDDLTVYSIYSDVTFGRFNLLTEYLWADVEHGRSATADAQPAGFWVQPSYRFTDSLEAVFRYSYLDSDGRGVSLSDGVRSAPSGGTMDKLTELYLGGTWYLKGNDLKFQTGFVYGKSEDTITGAPAEAEATGVRSQLQLNF